MYTQRIGPGSLMFFSKWWNFFYCYSHRKPRHTREKGGQREGRKKNSAGFCHRKNPPPEEVFFSQIGRAKKKSICNWIHTHKHARAILINLNCKKEHNLIGKKIGKWAAISLKKINKKKKSLGKRKKKDVIIPSAGISDKKEL